MTKEYAESMWQRYLEHISKTDEARIMENPAVIFTKEAKDGDYDGLSDDEYNTLLADVEEESHLFQENGKASSYAVFLRAYQRLTLSEKEILTISNVLAEASERADFTQPVPL